MSATILLLLLVFVAEGKRLPIRCVHTDTRTDGRDLCSTPLRVFLGKLGVA
jgi:hypothetical protein